MYFTGDSEPRDDAPGPRRGAAQQAKDIDRRAAAARAEFPEWDFHEVFGGWEAVPKGTRVVRGSFLETVTEKLRESRPYPGESR